MSDSHVAWRTTSNLPHIPSPLVVGNEIFLASDNGIASCRDVETGAIHWRHRVGGNFLAPRSPIKIVPLEATG